MRNLKLGLTLALVAASSACTPLDDVMVAVFGRSMRDQRSFDPYENTLNPPENSVPFAAGNLTADPYRFNTGQPEAAGADIPAPFTQLDLNSPIVNDLVNPVPADSASLARGEEMFLRVCAVCHGPTGIGTEAYIADKHPLVSFYDLWGPRAAGYSDGYIYGMVRVGRGIMPPYGHQVSHYDRWHIVNYVRELQRRAGTFPPVAAGGE